MGHLDRSEHSFQAIVGQDQSGWYLAECPALKDCYAQGQTYEEAIKNITLAVSKSLADLEAQKQPIPEQLEIVSVRWINVTAQPRRH
jgi:predicted RNase H-like HicB family nuclease